MAAKGRLQGWAAKLLLLWVGIFHFFSFQICNHVTAVSFFGLRTTADAWRRFFCVAPAAKKNGAKRMLAVVVLVVIGFQISNFSSCYLFST
ncbi:MAG TPA: hypothetical protein VLZ83_08270, partial [Edaphocola sp.]|nr:hypothetical protein [Edaphocola sp.]